MEILLIFILFILLLMVLSSLVLLMTGGNLFLYKKVYKELSSKTFYRCNSQIYDINYKIFSITNKNSFIWFIDDNSFKISDKTYLHNFIITYFSPIHLYWLIKYRRWFKKNVDINKIKQF